MNNVVFISGVPVFGKTDFILDISKKLKYVEQHNIYSSSSDNTMFGEKLHQIIKCRIDYDNIQEIAKVNPQKIFLCDQSVYDVKVRLDTVYELGWINEEQYSSSTNMLYALFHDDVMFPKYNYLFMPSLEKAQTWIERIKNTLWKVTNEYEQYLNKVYDNYYKLNKDNIKVVEDLTVRGRMSIMKKELEEIYLKECL